jgi:hypothetical protein
LNPCFQLSLSDGSLPLLAVLPTTLHDWIALFGRMHVIVIHFPIALLLMAALGEVWGRVRGHPVGWTTATLVFGAMGATLSMTLGWMLVIFDGYDASTTLTLHQYLARRPPFSRSWLRPHIGGLPEKTPDGGPHSSSFSPRRW